MEKDLLSAGFDLKKSCGGLKIVTGIFLTLLFFHGTSCNGQTTFKYYGVDDIQPEKFSFLKDSLGENFALIELPPGSVLWADAMASAGADGIKLVIWPEGDGHQSTTWAWEDSVRDIAQDLGILKFSEHYAASGGRALLAVVMSHEPFYNDGDPFNAAETKLLYTSLKDVAPHVELWVYMNDMSYYDEFPETRIENGIMDIAGTCLHSFGGEGTWEDSCNQIGNDRNLIDSKDLDIELFFAVRTFSINNTKYNMPSAAEMKEFGTHVLQMNKLDGIFWYPWGKVALKYDGYLSRDRYDNSGADRWSVVKKLSASLTDPAGITGLNNEKTGSAASTSLHNFPNPLEDNTTLEFKLVKSVFYNITVFDLQGHRIGNLLNKRFSRGTYKLEFNAGKLPGGNYICALRTKDMVVTRKMIIK